MSTWSGWEDDLLTAAGAPRIGNNRGYLDAWNAFANAPNCGNNPVDISHVEGTRRNCHKLTSTRTAQNYLNTAAAAKAFGQQLNGGNFPHLADGFLNGTLLTSSATTQIIAELRKWGSVKFADFVDKTSGYPGGPPPPGGIKAPHAHKGWADFQHSVNRNMPAALHDSQRTVDAALRRIGRARKVLH